MSANYSTLKAEGLKQLFIKDMEAKIIAGELKPGDHLPPERELAARMGISRSIVNSGILELAAKGFVAIRPRKGTEVVDFHHEGTPLALSSIMNYNRGKLDLKLFGDMLETRLLIEVECAQRAAKNRSREDLRILSKLLEEAWGDSLPSVAGIVDFNFNFHHRITLASGNTVYPMIFKSFEPVCRNLIGMYFASGDYRRQSIQEHQELYGAILARKRDEAGRLMEEILLRGGKELTKLNR